MSVENKKIFLKSLPSCPGVYQMLGKDREVLYVGKAKNLKKRITSYFKHNNIDDKKVSVLTSQVINFEIIVTGTENEALLLENTLIKKLKPKYNILFKDDKSYPYLLVSKHLFPRLILHRRIHRIPGDYYGPYPSATAARETLHILQKAFRLRQCSDVFFRNRSRPCVQYQIKRCSAPCTKYIDETTYQYNVNCVKKFLSGYDKTIIQELKAKMQNVALNLNYEAAACYRDQIKNLQKIYEQQYVDAKNGNVDAIAIIEHLDYFCIQILFIRNGKVIGNKSYFSKPLYKTNIAEVLTTFLSQYYLNPQHEKPLPKRILINKKLVDQTWIEAAINEYAPHKISISSNVKRNYRRWVEMAQTNAEYALSIYLATKNDFSKSLHDFKDIFKLPCLPQRIECFDVSHTMGEFTVASCVVFGEDGPKKTDYRQFNIKNVAKSDDYAAISQVLKRRYKTNVFPDVVIIDGGKGQLTKAKSVIKDNNIVLLAIAKSPLGKTGLERIYSSTLDKPVSLSADSSVLHLLQKIRDEAHRFALGAHRKKRAKIIKKSILENVEGIGIQKRKKILKYFTGIQEIKSATAQELKSVPGINQTLAERIYKSLHDDSN
jgi:excinuclease ABC subunit C